MVDRICANKAELYWYFTNLDYLHKVCGRAAVPVSGVWCGVIRCLRCHFRCVLRVLLSRGRYASALPPVCVCVCSRHVCAQGTVSRLEWADALATVLKLDLPFVRLEDDLVKPEADGSINYAKFLDRYRIEVRACGGVGGWVGGWVCVAVWVAGWLGGWVGGWVCGWLGGWVVGWLAGV